MMASSWKFWIKVKELYYPCSENKGAFAVTAKLICAFVFAYADCWFSHAAAHIILFNPLCVLQISSHKRIQDLHLQSYNDLTVLGMEGIKISSEGNLDVKARDIVIESVVSKLVDDQN